MVEYGGVSTIASPFQEEEEEREDGWTEREKDEEVGEEDSSGV